MKRGQESDNAFKILAEMAGVDGVTCGDESAMLDRFRRHLGISRRKARRYRGAMRSVGRQLPTASEDQLDLLEMMARVAYADGHLHTAERALLDEVAQQLGIREMRMARVLESAEALALRRIRQRRRWLLSTLAILPVALIAFLAWSRKEHGDEMLAFRSLERQYDRSIVLVHTRYHLIDKNGQRQLCKSTGSGFFVSREGHLITNKHVLTPWLFPGEASKLVAAGSHRVDPSSRVVFAWPSGSSVFLKDRKLDEASACSTRNRRLEIVALSEDHLRAGDRNAPSAGLHENDHNDLALLRCRLKGPVMPLPVARDTRNVRKLDPVMVMGFPRGLRMLEGTVAISSPTVGRVRKPESTIYITAPVVSGNSGGPLIGADGQVIGVATRTGGDSTLGYCIRAESVVGLLERAGVSAR